MKKLILTLVLGTNLMTAQVRAGEVALATVGGMVGTMAIVGLVMSVAATFGQSPLKGDLLEEAVDVVAIGDLSEISEELSESMDKYREEIKKEESKEIEDIELLDAMIQAQFELQK